MKKAFNFRTLLACALILVMCLTAFVACDKDKDQEQPYDANGINMAVRALKANVRGSSVNADFTLDNHQMFAGVSYPVSWAITANDGEASDVTLTVDGDKTTVHVNGKTKKDVAFSLTATVSDAKGLTATAEFKYSIPAYKLLTHAEYIATKAGEAVTVQGIVSHYGSKSNGAQYNNLFMYDQDGGYYIYTIANSVDPANIQGLHLGAKVEVTGKKDIYNGTHEVKDATIKVIDSSTQAVFEDITDVFKSATTISDAALAAYEYKLVTIKNVEIGDIDDSEKHNYYFFKSGSLETYIRLSTSECMLNAEQQAAFKTAFAADKGKLATVKGCVVLYNGQLYLNPVDTTPYTIVNTEGLSAQEQVNFAVGNTFVQSTVSGNGSSITLPTVDSIFNDVKITWSVDKTDLCAIADGKATFTFLTDNTVKLTATFTHSTDASATATKDFTITLKGAELITIAELYDKAVGDTAYYVEGYVVAVDKASDGKCSFVLQDGTASIFSYNKLDVKLGDHVKVLAKRSSDSYGFPQLGSISYEKLADGTFEPAVNEMAITDVKVTKEDAPADLYTKKYWKITGSTLVKGSHGYQGNYNGNQVLSLKLNEDLETVAKSLEGKNVVIYGYSRGINTAVKYFTVQVTKIEEAQMTDAEKVASVKASLSDLEVKKDFDLPTSEIATISWSKVSGDGATLEGNHVTITRTDVDQTVVFRAEISCGTESDTKDITVTIKANEVVDPNTVIVTAESLGIVGKTYGDSAAEGVVINGVTFKFEELCENGKGIQTRAISKSSNNKGSKLWNATACARPIKEIVIKLFNGQAGFSNNNTHSIKFGNTVNGADYTATLSTVKDQLEYTITPDAETYTYFTFEHNASYTYSAYFESITIVYADEVVKTDAEKVAEAKAALDLETKTTGVSFTLPTTGINGTTITWTSNNEAVIAINGENAVVTAPAAETVVTLTATIKLNEATATKTFDVTVTVTIPEFNVTINQPENGGTLAVTINDEAFTGGKVQQGKTLVIVPTAVDANHELVAILVNGTKLDAVEGVYSVTVNDAEVTITATFREIKYATVTVDEAIQNGTVAVTVNGEALDTTKQYRDGTVLTITATPANADYKLGQVKVNDEVVNGTYTIKETDTALTITATFVEKYPAMSIADFKSSETASNAAATLTGVVTSLDRKAAYVQDYDGNAIYVFFGNNNVPASLAVNKVYSFRGTKGNFGGVTQLASPTVVGEGTEPESEITAKVLDEEAYKSLTLANTSELVTIKGVVFTNNKWMLGATEISKYTGNAKDSASLNARVALLKEGVSFDLVNVHVSANNNKVQLTVDAAECIVIDWVPVATVDLKEIGVNGTAKITVTANPAVTTDVKATFVTENDQIATVDANGVVTGVAVGTVGINVTANGHTVKVGITVVAVAQEFTVNYTKTVDGANGSIASVMAGETAVEPGTKVVKGTKVTVTVAPAEGYQLASYTLNGGEAVAAKGQTSFDITVTDNVTIAVTFEVKPAEPQLVATFTFATSSDTTQHIDGSAASKYTDTQGTYTLTIETVTNFYTKANDKTGIGALKLGTGKKTGSFSVTGIQDDVKYVVFYVAGYKAKTTTVTIDGTNYAINTLSDNGEYTAIKVAVSDTKTISFASGTSGDKRCLISKIEFMA